MPSKPPLRTRLAGWKPPDLDTGAKPRGAPGRVFPDAVRKIRGGGFRPGERAKTPGADETGDP